MVRFIGPFTLEAGSRARHSIDIPNYVGSVRVMVVAQNNGAFGKSQKTVTVKQPVMVLATLPRLIGPTEELSVPITVFAMEDHVKEVSVEITTNDFLQLKISQFSFLNQIPFPKNIITLLIKLETIVWKHINKLQREEEEEK